VITVSDDKTARRWEIKSSQSFNVLSGHGLGMVLVYLTPTLVLMVQKLLPLPMIILPVFGRLKVVNSKRYWQGIKNFPPVGSEKW